MTEKHFHPDDPSVRENEDRLKFALEVSNTGAWDLDLLNHTAHRSLRHDQIFGYESLLPEWTYETFLEHVLPGDREAVDRQFRQAVASGGDWSFECRIRRRDGQIRWIWAAGRHRADPSGKPTHMGGIVQDITDRKRAEEVLRESEHRQRAILDTIPDPAWLKDKDGRCLAVNAAWCRFFDMDAKDVLGKKTFEFFPPEVAEKMWEHDRTVMQSRHSLHLDESFRDKNGDLAWFETIKTPLFNDQGKVVGTTGLARDITERKRAEESLRESRAELEVALASMTDAVFISDAEGRFIEINDAFATFHRFKNKDECSKICSEYHDVLDVFMVNGEPAPLNEWVIPRALRGEAVTNAEYTLRRKDTGETWIGSYSFAPIRDKDGKIVGVVVVARDITDRKRVDDALRESEERLRLAAQAANFGTYDYDLVANTLYWSPELKAIWGLHPDDPCPIAENNVHLGVHPDDRANVAIALNESLNPQGNGLLRLEHRIVRPDGSVRWVLAQGRVYFSGDGETQHAVRAAGTFLDITDRKRAEEKVLASEAILREAQELACLGSYVLDISKGRWTSSEVLDRLFDIPLDYARTVEGWGNFVHPDERQAMLDYLRDEVIGKHKPFDREYRIVRFGDNQVRWVHGLGRLEFDAAGLPTAMLGTIQDISDRKRAEEMVRASEEKYRTYINNSPAGVFVADSTGRYVEVNASACHLLGYSEEELTQMAISDVVAPEDLQSAMTGFHEAIQTGAAVSGEFCFVRKDGSRFFMSVHAVRVQKDRVIGFCEDITKRVDTARSLKQYSASLQQTNQRLEEACDKADAANRAKSEFLANMSHELRTPMTAVLGFSDVLLMSPELPPSEQREFLEVIQKNGKALLRLLDEILDLSRIEADRLPLEKTDYPVRQITDDVMSAVQLQAEQKGLSLDVDYQFPLPETICTDPARLRQVLVNLVGNAVKFTEQGGVRIALRCAREADGAGRIQFAVSDTGIGIPADKIKELFHPFMQVDASSTRRYGGTGMGLAISRHLANALGGDIEVTSQLGKGSTFTLTIDAGPLKGVPMLQSPHAAPSAEEPLPGTQELILHGRVLFVEDVPEVRSLMGFLLKKTNLEVEMAEDGRMACEMVEKSKAVGRPYDLIFMDIQMPEMDGYDATRWLRQHGWQGPIVALTAYAMVGDRNKCFAAGFDDYISKPITPQGLREMLTRYIPGHGDTAAAKHTDPTDAAQAILPPNVQAAKRTTMDRLREGFIGGLPERAQVLEAAWRAGNRQALAQAAHQLKGTAGAYGLSGIAQAAQAVESLVTSKSVLSDLQLAVHELLKLCTQAAEAKRSGQSDTPAQE